MPNLEPRTSNPEPGTRNPEPRYTSPVTRTFVRVVLLEAAIVIALVVLGRMFS